jgi:hypothetical protein
MVDPVYRAPFSHWSNFTFAQAAGFTFEWMAEPSHLSALSADIVLSPLTDLSPRQHYIITPQIKAIANQLSYVTDLNYKMALLKRIEFVEGADLDRIWGDVYKVKRRYGEADDAYRKRLQVYLLQLAGSGTKAAIENIISIIVEYPNACRVDTYWPGHCRIYISDGMARIKARARLDLINLVLPDTLAAGVNYRFYIPYYDLAADLALMGPDYNYLTATGALIGEERLPLDARLIMATRHDEPLDADIVVGGVTYTPLVSDIALRHESLYDLPARLALAGPHPFDLAASEALSGAVETPCVASMRLWSGIQTELDADIAMQANRLRPIEARIHLVIS